MQLSGDSCFDVCGDGLVAEVQQGVCDDGNFIDGDGCSSVCQEEARYSCQNGSTTSPSSCVYIGPVTFSQRSTQKVSGLNQAAFSFDASPSILNIAKMDLGSLVSLDCDSNSTVNSVSYVNGVLDVAVDYNSTLEGRVCSLSVVFDPAIIESDNFSLSFTAQSNGASLTVSDESAAS